MVSPLGRRANLRIPSGAEGGGIGHVIGLCGGKKIEPRPGFSGVKTWKSGKNVASAVGRVNGKVKRTCIKIARGDFFKSNVMAARECVEGGNPNPGNLGLIRLLSHYQGKGMVQKRAKNPQIYFETGHTWHVVCCGFFVSIQTHNPLSTDRFCKFRTCLMFAKGDMRLKGLIRGHQSRWGRWGWKAEGPRGRSPQSRWEASREAEKRPEPGRKDGCSSPLVFL